MARSSKTDHSSTASDGVDALENYRRRVKRAFRSRPSAPATGTAVANPGVTEDEDAQRARHSGSHTPEGENT